MIMEHQEDQRSEPPDIHIEPQALKAENENFFLNI